MNTYKLTHSSSRSFLSSRSRCGNRIGTGGSTTAGIVAYVATNPNARYILAGLGSYANGGRNTFPMAPIELLRRTGGTPARVRLR